MDGLIAEGTLGGAERNVAAHQIATSVSLLPTVDDLRPYIEGRPAEGPRARIMERQPGRLPPALPGDWLPPHG